MEADAVNRAGLAGEVQFLIMGKKVGTSIIYGIRVQNFLDLS